MSQVAGGKLRQERFFTRPEIDPFDEIEWDIRDALIGTPEKIAFEQKNIEFPKTWSQNATNIVAQKYFRGPLNTPQREAEWSTGTPRRDLPTVTFRIRRLPNLSRAS
jgi:hypothetical protein